MSRIYDSKWEKLQKKDIGISQMIFIMILIMAILYAISLIVSLL